jgi:hypothetical protein
MRWKFPLHLEELSDLVKSADVSEENIFSVLIVE